MRVACGVRLQRFGVLPVAVSAVLGSLTGEAQTTNAIVDVHGDDPEFGYRFIAEELEQTGHRDAAIAAGGAHSCALLADGTAKCWALNSSGQLGDGTTTNVSTPVVVTGLSSAIRDHGR